MYGGQQHACRTALSRDCRLPMDFVSVPAQKQRRCYADQPLHSEHHHDPRRQHQVNSSGSQHLRILPPAAAGFLQAVLYRRSQPVYNALI